VSSDAVGVADYTLDNELDELFRKSQQNKISTIDQEKRNSIAFYATLDHARLVEFVSSMTQIGFALDLQHGNNIGKDNDMFQIYRAINQLLNTSFNSARFNMFQSDDNRDYTTIDLSLLDVTTPPEMPVDYQPDSIIKIEYRSCGFIHFDSEFENSNSSLQRCINSKLKRTIEKESFFYPSNIINFIERLLDKKYQLHHVDLPEDKISNNSQDIADLPIPERMSQFILQLLYQLSNGCIIDFKRVSEVNRTQFEQREITSIYHVPYYQYCGTDIDYNDLKFYDNDETTIVKEHYLLSLERLFNIDEFSSLMSFIRDDVFN
jgi:hypothetical protein